MSRSAALCTMASSRPVIFLALFLLAVLTSCAHRQTERQAPDQHIQKYIQEEYIEEQGMVSVHPDRGKRSNMHVQYPDARKPSIWPLLTNHFHLKANRSDRYYQHYLRRYQQHPHYLEQKLRNTPYYLHYILSEIKRRNMPAELALLPLIESQYDPFAYSYAKAGGMWQIMPQTAKHLDLSMDWWYDERRDIRLATHAALDYLEELYATFDDWILAIAAYNAGPGTVKKAIKARGGSRNFWRLALSKQTQDYVPKLLAIAHVIKHHEKFDVQLPMVPNAPYFLTVKLHAPMHLKNLAITAGVPFTTIKRLNAGYNQWVTPPNRKNVVVVPYMHFEAIRQALQQAENRNYQWLPYQVQAGDNLSKLAAQYHTSAEDIQAVNHMPHTSS